VYEGKLYLLLLRRFWNYNHLLVILKVDLFCVVGNKDDNDRKVVEPGDARRLADQVGIPFFETSAKENKNVEEVGMLYCKEVLCQFWPVLQQWCLIGWVTSFVILVNVY